MDIGLEADLMLNPANLQQGLDLECTQGFLIA
jgi:hypothetical protein